MKLPLQNGNELIHKLLQEQWHLNVTAIHFIPLGNSAYSYRVDTQSGDSYYLKIVDQRTSAGQSTASHMMFSLPLQHLVAYLHLAQISAPCPQPTITGSLYAIHEAFLCALYTFIQGETLANAYPMSPQLVQRIGQALAIVHTIQAPDELRRQSPQDSLTIPFDADLLRDLAALETISSHDAPYLQRLREVTWPQREQIRAFLAHSQEYALQAQRTRVSLVVCHGDAWGGNIIISPAGRLTLLDWEAAVIAPPERDAFIYMGYIGPDFTAFKTGYQTIQQKPMRWHANLLAYYAYRLQLRNLSHWLHDLLHEPLNDIQRDNDVTMIEHHCLDRLQSVERTASDVVAGSTDGYI